jgi:hypothetical protein
MHDRGKRAVAAEQPSSTNAGEARRGQASSVTREDR